MPVYDLSATVQSEIHLTLERDGDRLNLLAYTDVTPDGDCRDLLSCYLERGAVRVLFQACAAYLNDTRRVEVLTCGGAV